MNINNRIKLILPYLLIIFAAVLRFLPHPPNFAPIAALALFGGVYLDRKYALAVPLLAMLMSDYFIGFYSPAIMASVYGSFLLIGLIGLWLRHLKKFHWIIGTTLAGSVLFYLITNWAVWAFGTLYPKTLLGLMQSYYLALPFFRNTLLGDLFYVGVLFGSLELVLYLQKKYVKSKVIS